MRTLRTAIIALAVAGLVTIGLTTLAYAGPRISSDSEFVREGRRAYKCRTPRGDRVTCNKWVFGRGWKQQSIARNKSAFSKLSDRTGKRIPLRRPDKGKVALFDRAWSDHRLIDELIDEYVVDRGVPIPFEVYEAELLRELRPADFKQFVEVRDEGTYELRACMASHLDTHPGFDGIFVGGGISVQLEQIHANTSRPGTPVEERIDPEFIAEVPVKARGPEQNEGETWGVQWVNQLPTGVRHNIAGINGQNGVFVHDGLGWKSPTGSYNHGGGEFFLNDPVTEIDSHTGHAGLQTAYALIGENKTEAIWTCHSNFVALARGFYVIRGVANPYWNDADEALYEDYDGFGAIRMVYLRKANHHAN